MTQVLLVGLQLEAVDYSDPALPQGMDAKKIWAGIDLQEPHATARHHSRPFMRHGERRAGGRPDQADL